MKQEDVGSNHKSKEIGKEEEHDEQAIGGWQRITFPTPHGDLRYLLLLLSAKAHVSLTSYFKRFWKTDKALICNMEKQLVRLRIG